MIHRKHRMNTGASFRRYLAQKLHALHFYCIGLPWASTRCDFCQALLGTCCFVHIRQNDVIRSTPIPAHYYPKAFPPLACLVLQLLLSVALCTPCKYYRRLQRDIILLKLSGTCSFCLFAFVRNVTRSTPTTTHHGRQTSPNIRPSSMSFSTVRLSRNYSYQLYTLCITVPWTSVRWDFAPKFSGTPLHYVFFFAF